VFGPSSFLPRPNTDWLDSRHSFSFGSHYEPDNTHFGSLLVSNDDRVRAGTGFDSHPHRDMEIITWVLEGSLVHQDSTGHSGVIYPGLAQRMSAGRGILHSEKNDSWTLTGEPAHASDVRFIQMWVVPDEPNLAPSYEQHELGADLDSGRWVTIASGMRVHQDSAAISIHNRGSALHVARPTSSDELRLPDAPFVHLYVARGVVELEGGGVLHPGDAARIRASSGQRITPNEDTELLVWEMHSDPFSRNSS
jgi:quercetin 2,3-dioxygenase